MSFEEITGLTDVNVGDKVFRNTTSSFIGKVRLQKRPSVNGGEAFSLSISEADNTGKTKLKDPTADRATELGRIANGEVSSADVFVIGEETTLTIMLTNSAVDLDATLTAEIEQRMIEMESFVTKQQEVAAVYKEWGI